MNFILLSEVTGLCSRVPAWKAFQGVQGFSFGAVHHMSSIGMKQGMQPRSNGYLLRGTMLNSLPIALKNAVPTPFQHLTSDDYYYSSSDDYYYYYSCQYPE